MKHVLQGKEHRAHRAAPGVGASLFSAILVFASLSTGYTARADWASDRAGRIGSSIVSTNTRSESRVQYGVAEAVVNAPMDKVLQVLGDYSNYHEFLPHFEQSRVLSRRNDDAMVYMEATILYGAASLWAQMRLSSSTPKEGERLIEGRMVQGNMSTFHARWKVTNAGENRTLVSFQLLVDVDMPVPASLVDEENRKAARSAMKALRRQVAHPRYQ